MGPTVPVCGGIAFLALRPAFSFSSATPGIGNDRIDGHPSRAATCCFSRCVTRFLLSIAALGNTYAMAMPIAFTKNKNFWLGS